MPAPCPLPAVRAASACGRAAGRRPTARTSTTIRCSHHYPARSRGAHACHRRSRWRGTCPAGDGTDPMPTPIGRGIPQNEPKRFSSMNQLARRVMTGRVLTSALTRTLAPSPRRNAGTVRLHPANACASNNRGAFSTSYHTSRPVHPIRSFRSFQSFRSFASSASSDALLEELQKEVAHERSNYTQSSADAPPEPWSLTEVEGDTLMTLTRSFGKETVCVDIMINDQLEKEEQPIYFEVCLSACSGSRFGFTTLDPHSHRSPARMLYAGRGDWRNRGGRVG